MKRPPFDGVTIFMHWTTVLLVTAMFMLAWLMGQTQDADNARLVLTLHRSTGVALWTLTAARLLWRLTGAKFPPFPETMPSLQRLAAQLSEYGLYALLLVQPVTGVAQSLYRGRAFDLWLWRVPAVVARDRDLVRLFHQAHEWGAWALAGLIGIHASAALLHALVLRDGVFQSMWPFGRNRQAG